MTFSRRGFIAVAAAGVGAVIQDTVKAGPVYDPQRAGRAQLPITAADNDAGIQAGGGAAACASRVQRRMARTRNAPAMTITIEGTK